MLKGGEGGEGGEGGGAGTLGDTTSNLSLLSDGAGQACWCFVATALQQLPEILWRHDITR